MVKAIGTVVCPMLVFGMLVVPLGGCGSRVNVRPGPESSKTVARSQGNSAGMNPGNEAGELPVSVSTAAKSGSMLLSLAEAYRIGPEDVLRISVWNNTELTQDLVVRPDGKISVPLIQDIQAEGLTAAELAERIEKRLLQFIKDPHVSVIVLQVNASKFYIVGAVAKPGTYPLRGDVSVLQALSMAGGFTPFASLRNIRLVRNMGGKQEVRVINYFKVIEDGGDQNYLIRPGDTIVVP